MRSPYSLDNHPPAEPPPGVICPGLWTVQVRLWKRHTPWPGTTKCQECTGTASWPCHSWLSWDGQLGDAWAAHIRHVAEQKAAQDPAEDADRLVLAALAHA